MVFITRQVGSAAEKLDTADAWPELAAKNEEGPIPKTSGEDVEQQHQSDRGILDDELDKYSEHDRDLNLRLLAYTRWYDPANQTEIQAKMLKHGHAREFVEIYARRLQDDGLIKITENHYLPLNEEVCQQAAESLTPEFLLELEA